MIPALLDRVFKLKEANSALFILRYTYLMF